jgi:hypothetical protein
MNIGICMWFVTQETAQSITITVTNIIVIIIIIIIIITNMIATAV